MKVAYKNFKAKLSTEKVKVAAAEFASRLDPSRLISISQARYGYITVWYWE